MGDKECESSYHHENSISTAKVFGVSKRISKNIEALLKDMRAEGSNLVPDMEVLKADQASLSRKLHSVTEILFQNVTSEQGDDKVIVTDSKESWMLADALFRWFLKKEETIEGQMDKYRKRLEIARGKRPIDPERKLELFDYPVDQFRIAIGPRRQAALAVEDGEPTSSNMDTTNSNTEEIQKIIDKARNMVYRLSDLISQVIRLIHSSNMEMTILERFISALEFLSQNNDWTIVKYVYDESVKANDIHAEAHPRQMKAINEDEPWIIKPDMVDELLTQFMAVLVRLDSFLNYVTVFINQDLEKEALLGFEMNMDAIENQVNGIVYKIREFEHWSKVLSSK